MSLPSFSLTPPNIAHLKIVQTLGEGSFGEVKLLKDRDDSNIVMAVKMMDLIKHKDQSDNFRREALLQKHVSGHINILSFLNMRITSRNVFQLFIEYADGGDLFDRIKSEDDSNKSKKMDLSEAKFFFAQLINGLEFMHSKGIVHRDIKPENLLLTKKNILKISDFGMATIYRHNGRERMLDTRCGTWPYVAPEVLLDKYRGPPIDLWSAGVVLVTMLVGELPWEYPKRIDERFRRWVDCEVDNCEPWKSIGKSQLSFLKGILEPNPLKRFQLASVMDHPWFEHSSSQLIDIDNNYKEGNLEAINATDPSAMLPIMATVGTSTPITTSDQQELIGVGWTHTF